MSAKRDFGSFHSSNVRELISLPANLYSPPKIPVAAKRFDHLHKNVFSFGKQAKVEHFFLEESVVFLNHGAFGCVLHEALLSSQEWQCYIEQQPLRFFDRELLPLLVHISRNLAEFIGCDAADIALVPNATTGTNSVLRSLAFKQGDQILYLSTAYGAVKKLIEQVCHDTGAEALEVNVTFPVDSQQQIVDLVAGSLTAQVKLAIFDHIPSNTPFILPVKELAELCHKQDTQILIDGAHALGQIDLSISDFGPVDYYVTNAHKWFCAPKGCALLYVDKTRQATVHSVIISHGHKSGFNSQFIWSGLRDYSPFLALDTILLFWRTVGPRNIQNYMKTLAEQAANLLTQRWQTSLLVPLNMTAGMLCVGLPESLWLGSAVVNYDRAEQIQNQLYQQFNIEVPVKAVQGRLYVRISCHIHNSLEDYECLASAVLQLCQQPPEQAK